MSATKSLTKVLGAKSLDRKRRQLSQKDQKLCENFYTQGHAVYGSNQNLMKARKLSKYKSRRLSWLEQTVTQSTTLREKKINRLKTQVYRINKIWSIDVSYMDKNANYNNGVMYILVAVKVSSGLLRFEPRKLKLRQTKLVLSRE